MLVSQTIMNGIRDKLLTRWHKMLNLRRYPSDFHHRRLTEELAEQHAATGPINKLSETSDVLFTISRARHEGHPVGVLPPLCPSHAPAYAYMLAKFTSRWGFYRTAAYLSGPRRRNAVREVVNPFKDEKLFDVALRHELDSRRFALVAVRLRRVWPLLP